MDQTITEYVKNSQETEGLRKAIGFLIATDKKEKDSIGMKILDTLNNKTQSFTVFAPTNEAFEPIFAKAKDLMDKKDNVALMELQKVVATTLFYHVVAGSYSASSFKKGFNFLTTANNKPIVVNVGDDGVMVCESNVVKADIKLSNGIIHMIDKVMDPNACTVLANTKKRMPNTK